jgi:uncharacterized membrane protein
MNWRLDQNVVNQTFGAFATTAGAITIAAATQGLATGWAASTTLTINTTQTVTLNVGDTFTIAGVNPVNPQNRQAYGSNRLRTFTITQGVAAQTAGNFTITVVPALIYGGQFQNISNTPTNGSALAFTSLPATTASAVTSPQNILFHRNAYTLAVADLELPEGVHFAGRASDKEIGLSIRVVRQYTINNDAIPTRLDVLYGWAPLYQEFGCRVCA